MKKIRSTAKPYDGGSPFIFVSYSHKDSRYVYPIIEYLARDGFRIWYDEGISPSSEWNEVIANHMNKASVCIAFISENAAASHNCRREISYALLKNKPLLSIFLEETTLTPGMEMQLSANQCMSIDTYANMNKFLEAIVEASVLKPCQGATNVAIEVHSSSYYEQQEEEEPAPQPVADISDDWFAAQEFVPQEKKPVAAQERKSVAQERQLPRQNFAAPERELPRQQFAAPERELPRQEFVAPERNPVEYVLIRQATRELIALDKGYLSVGRTTDGTKSKYAISNNHEISRKHFVIQERNGGYFIMDCESKNHTYLNGIALPPNEPAKLNNGDEICISKEKFVFRVKPAGGDRLA
ncbi:MAG: TIR domain-containing protein [Peptococcaceae bacterium]|nr:TIR domain-containing protein [Peptococcaceae bacterium]